MLMKLQADSAHVTLQIKENVDGNVCRPALVLMHQHSTQDGVFLPSSNEPHSDRVGFGAGFAYHINIACGIYLYIHWGTVCARIDLPTLGFI